MQNYDLGHMHCLNVPPALRLERRNLRGPPQRLEPALN